jgi:exo-1,4-beta-D-glucosaminidase
VTVHNPTSTLALAVHLMVNKSSNGRVSREGEEDNEILPVLWQDNYFALLPGEARQVTATYRLGDKSKATPSVEIEGWNVNRKTADVQQ